MKQTKTIFKTLLLVLMHLSLMACDKGNGDGNPPAGEGCYNCTFTASIAEAAVNSYNATTAKAVWTKKQISGSEDRYTLYVAGEDKVNKRLLHFFLYSPTMHTPGTYAIKFSTSNQAYYIENYNASGEKSWVAPGPATDMEASFGTVTVTEITATRAKGTFTFTAYENSTHATIKTITDGNFDVSLTKQGF